MLDFRVLLISSLLFQPCIVHANLMTEGSLKSMSDRLSQVRKMKAENSGRRSLVDAIIDYSEIPTIPAQTFFIPLPEDSLLTDTFQPIYPPADGPVISIVSLAISTDNTIVWYDHWEDGLDSDVTTFNSSGTTEIWGDYNATTGCQPNLVAEGECTDENDALMAGESIVVQTSIPIPRDISSILHDGGDVMHSNLPIAVTRGAYPDYPGSYLAGAVEVLDTSFMGTKYVVPVGQDTYIETEAFDFCGIYVVAITDNSTITLPDGTSVLMNMGDVEFVTVETKGAIVTGDNAFQVHLVTGDPYSYYELRWFSLTPYESWSTTYYSPVGNKDGGSKVVLFNPHDYSLKISYHYLAGGDVGADKHKWFMVDPGENEWTGVIPDGSGVMIEADDVFAGIAVIDTVDLGQVYDWGFSLIPIDFLTPMVLVGWGYGCTNLTCSDNASQGKGKSRNVVWVTPMEDADMYIDYNNDGVVDNDKMGVGKMQGKIFKQESDDDLSGALVWATVAGDPDGPDGVPVKIAAAWGQDPDASDNTDDLAMDLGTVIVPFRAVSACKKSFLVEDDDDDAGTIYEGVISQGDRIRYVITVTNVGQVDLAIASVRITDTLDEHVTYIEGTTTYTFNEDETISVDDNTEVGSTPFPLDPSSVDGVVDGMTNLRVLSKRGGTADISFDVIIDEGEMMDGVVFLYNFGYATANGMRDDFDNTIRLPPQARSFERSSMPSDTPTQLPSEWPSTQPSSKPSVGPTSAPNESPSTNPSSKPSGIPDAAPTDVPTKPKRTCPGLDEEEQEL